MGEKMSLEDARNILFAYACCAVGMCEICPFIGDPPSYPCDGEKLENIREAVEIVARELAAVQRMGKEECS